MFIVFILFIQFNYLHLAHCHNTRVVLLMYWIIQITISAECCVPQTDFIFTPF